MRAIITILSTLCVFSIVFVVLGSPPFGTKEDVKYSERLWKALTNAKLAGEHAIASIPYAAAVHKKVLITLDSTVRVGNHTGTVIIKKMFQGDDVTVESVANNPTKNLKFVAVMFQREKGFDTKNQDWFYIRYDAKGRPTKNKKGILMVGRFPKCISCHQAAPGGNYIYSFTR